MITLRPGPNVRRYLPNRSTTSMRCCGTILTALPIVTMVIRAIATTTTASTTSMTASPHSPVCARSSCTSSNSSRQTSAVVPRSSITRIRSPGSIVWVASYTRAVHTSPSTRTRPLCWVTCSSTTPGAPSSALMPIWASAFFSAGNACLLMIGRSSHTDSADASAKTATCTTSPPPRPAATAAAAAPAANISSTSVPVNASATANTSASTTHNNDAITTRSCHVQRGYASPRDRGTAATAGGGGNVTARTALVSADGGGDAPRRRAAAGDGPGRERGGGADSGARAGTQPGGGGGTRRRGGAPGRRGGTGGTVAPVPDRLHHQDHDRGDGDAATRRRSARVGRSAPDLPAGYADRRRDRATAARPRLRTAPRAARAVVGAVRRAERGGAAGRGGRRHPRRPAAAPAPL